MNEESWGVQMKAIRVQWVQDITYTVMGKLENKNFLRTIYQTAIVHIMNHYCDVQIVWGLILESSMYCNRAG